MLLIALAIFAVPEAGGYLRGLISGRSGCTVTRVVDGDTAHAYCPGMGIRSVRLLGYDTPEVFSPKCFSEWWAGTRATWALQARIWTADDVTLVLSGTDRYDRRLGTLLLDGRNVARSMIEAGHARAYSGGKREGWCW